MFDITLYLRREGAAGQGYGGSQRAGLSNWAADSGPEGDQPQERGGAGCLEAVSLGEGWGSYDSCDR